MSETKEQKMIREHQEDLQCIRAFRPIDDVFMRALFFENLPLAQMVLRIVTATPDLTLTHCETQADLKHITSTRSLTLDLYASDTSGKKYDLDVQKRSDRAQPHRARCTCPH